MPWVHGNSRAVLGQTTVKNCPWAHSSQDLPVGTQQFMNCPRSDNTHEVLWNTNNQELPSGTQQSRTALGHWVSSQELPSGTQIQELPFLACRRRQVSVVVLHQQHSSRLSDKPVIRCQVTAAKRAPRAVNFLLIK